MNLTEDDGLSSQPLVTVDQTRLVLASLLGDHGGAASSVADYDRIHRTCLARLPGVSAMHSRFTIRTIKNWNGYPVGVAATRE